MGKYKEVISVIFIILFIFSIIMLATIVFSSLLFGIFYISFKYIAATLFI